MNQTLFRVGEMGLSSTIQEFALRVSRQKNKWSDASIGQVKAK